MLASWPRPLFYPLPGPRADSSHPLCPAAMRRPSPRTGLVRRVPPSAGPFPGLGQFLPPAQLAPEATVSINHRALPPARYHGFLCPSPGEKATPKPHASLCPLRPGPVFLDNPTSPGVPTPNGLVKANPRPSPVLPFRGERRAPCDKPAHVSPSTDGCSSPVPRRTVASKAGTILSFVVPQAMSCRSGAKAMVAARRRRRGQSRTRRPCRHVRGQSGCSS